MLSAIDIAILPPEPVKSLAIGLSKKVSLDFHLNETDVLPHITLGIGFLEGSTISSVKSQISTIAASLRPFEIIVERVEGRYLMCDKSDRLYKLHKAICDAVNFVHLKDLKGADEAYSGTNIIDSTKDFTNNYKWCNAYGKFIPHVTIVWDDKVKVDASKVRELPLKFKVEEIFICQLGNHNTCRKVMAKFRLGS